MGSASSCFGVAGDEEDNKNSYVEDGYSGDDNDNGGGYDDDDDDGDDDDDDDDGAIGAMPIPFVLSQTFEIILIILAIEMRGLCTMKGSGGHLSAAGAFLLLPAQTPT